MRIFTKFITLCIVLGVAAASCVKEPEVSFEDIEQRSLKAWIEKHHPELINNYQEDGGYYVEVLDEGCLDSLPITGKDVWLWYDFTGRDLDGNVCESRNDSTAYQQGTFNVHTRYIPAYRFSGAEAHTLMEGSYLATFNELNIGGEKFSVRYGTKLRLYLPSSVIDGSNGIEGDGGYEGQFSLDGNVPMILDMTIYGHVNNPVAYEGNHVDSFANINGGLCSEHKAKIDKAETSSLRRHLATRNDEQTEEDTKYLEFFDGRWHQPIDTLAQLYVNYNYSPARNKFDFNAIGKDTLMYPDQSIYRAGSFSVYGTQTMDEIDRRINDALVERFGDGISGDKLAEADSVSKKGAVNVWYVGRFLDGFVFDTNIDEVKQIVFGKVEEKGTPLEFDVKKALDTPEDAGTILAWAYAIPTLRIGQWATILTVSTYAYGIAGKVGTHTSDTTSDTSYYDYMNYMNYMNYLNSYYGYGYGSMYNNGYYGYANPYYYGFPGTYDDGSESTTVTYTSSEVPAYTPLLFQIFISK